MREPYWYDEEFKKSLTDIVIWLIEALAVIVAIILILIAIVLLRTS